jgi:hypothetical protein
MELPTDWTFASIEQELHETATAKVGYDDFGDPSYLEGLRHLLAAYDQDSLLTPMGRWAARYDLQRTLTARLRSEQLLREHAAELDYAIERPIFITGLVRTGSTALHYLMGQDPGLQALPHWLAENPIPRPRRDQWEAHPNFQRTQRRLRKLYEDDPARASMHYMTAELPEECGHLIAQSFTDDRYIVSCTLPSYVDWYEGTEHPATYVRHRALVALIGSTQPDKRWLLKYPVHLRQLPALLAVYPDACIVQTHRDPVSVLRSYTNMVASYRASFEEPVDRLEIARSQMESWARAAERGIAARTAPGRARFYDLHFGDFVADPIGSVKKIYASFDQQLSAAGEAALASWRDANPQGAHGRHQYEEQEFPLRREEIVERFSDYLDYFDMRGRLEDRAEGSPA